MVDVEPVKLVLSLPALNSQSEDRAMYHQVDAPQFLEQMLQVILVGLYLQQLPQPFSMPSMNRDESSILL